MLLEEQAGQSEPYDMDVYVDYEMTQIKKPKKSKKADYVVLEDENKKRLAFPLKAYLQVASAITVTHDISSTLLGKILFNKDLDLAANALISLPNSLMTGVMLPLAVGYALWKPNPKKSTLGLCITGAFLFSSIFTAPVRTSIQKSFETNKENTIKHDHKPKTGMILHSELNHVGMEMVAAKDSLVAFPTLVSNSGQISVSKVQ